LSDPFGEGLKQGIADKKATDRHRAGLRRSAEESVEIAERAINEIVSKMRTTHVIDHQTKGNATIADDELRDHSRKLIITSGRPYEDHISVFTDFGGEENHCVRTRDYDEILKIAGRYMALTADAESRYGAPTTPRYSSYLSEPEATADDHQLDNASGSALHWMVIVGGAMLLMLFADAVGLF
jgi:hypothetical protein